MATMVGDLVKMAKEAFFDEHFQDAVDLFSQAIDLNPNNPDLYADRAQAHLKLSNFTEAAADSNRAIELDPSVAKAFLRNGAAWLKLEEYQTAKSAFQSGATLAPQDSRFTHFIRKCDKLLAEVAVSDGSNTDYDSSPTVPEAKPNFRHEYYQKLDEVVVTIFAEEIPAKSVSVDYGEQILSVTIDIPGQEPYCLQPRLFGKILPAKCSYEVLSAKIEIRLAKAVPSLWTTLELCEYKLVKKIKISASALRSPYLSSVRVIDWNRFESQVKKEEKDEKLDEDAALNKFFQGVDEDNATSHAEIICGVLKNCSVKCQPRGKKMVLGRSREVPQMEVKMKIPR